MSSILTNSPLIRTECNPIRDDATRPRLQLVERSNEHEITRMSTATFPRLAISARPWNFGTAACHHKVVTALFWDGGCEEMPSEGAHCAFLKMTSPRYVIWGCSGCFVGGKKWEERKLFLSSLNRGTRHQGNAELLFFRNHCWVVRQC